MRLARVGESIVGRRLARTVFLSDGRALLRAGTTLTSPYVASLKRHRFDHVYVQNEILPDLPFDADIREEVRARATAQVKRAAEQVARGGRIDVQKLRQSVEEILDEVQGDQDVLYGLAVVRSADDYTFTHSVNVAVLSLAIGVRSGIVRNDLVKLGVGAILHDVGKALLPRDLLQKKGELTPEERAVMETHTTLGFRALREETPELSPLSTNVALSHHERLDGSGYPRHIRGDEIHLFSRIVAVADVWDAMVTNRLYRTARPHVEAANELRSGAGRLYDAEIVRRALLRVAVFPTGSVVRLSDDRLAIVTEQDRADPERPWAVVVADRRNRPLPRARVRIGEGGLVVTGLLDDLPAGLR